MKDWMDLGRYGMDLEFDSVSVSHCAVVYFMSLLRFFFYDFAPQRKQLDTHLFSIYFPSPVSTIFFPIYLHLRTQSLQPGIEVIPVRAPAAS
jgi:hypothetical protein